MNLRALLPAVDPAPLPGPPWLFHLLWLVTFTVHLLLVDVVLGGSIVAALAALTGKGDARRAGPAFFLKVNTWAISFAITFAIAPLLFLQVLYGRFFYSATVLIPWTWLALLGFVTIAYYLNYLAKSRAAVGANPAPYLVVQAVLFLGVAAVQVVVHLLHVQPGRWAGVADHPRSAWLDPSFAPRLLHFVFAAVALAGGAPAWWEARHRGDRAAEGKTPLSPAAHLGLTGALVATALQISVGFWLLFSLPRPVLISFLRSGPLVQVPFGLGVLLGVGAAVALGLCLSPLVSRRLVRHAMELMVVSALCMIVTRHQLRETYLAFWREGESVPVQPQWGVFALFLLLLLACGGVTFWALRRAARERPLPGEPVA